MNKSTPVDYLLHLSQIFLNYESNRNPDLLITQILRLAMDISFAEGGTIYLVTTRNTLLFKIVANDIMEEGGLKNANAMLGLEIPLFDDEGKPLQSNVCCQAFHKVRTIHIADAYADNKFELTGLKNFDQKNNYHSKSILTVPIFDNGKKVIAIMQLVNARDPITNNCIEFSENAQKTIGALAAITGLQISNLQLIEKLNWQIDASSRIQAEKDRLLRDLHDGMGSQLVRASIKLRDGELSLKESHEIIDNALKELREIINGYMHFDENLLKMVSLTASQYADIFRLQSSRSIEFKFIGNQQDAGQFEVNVVVNLIQILREILTNCLKHSAAKKIIVILRIQKKCIDLAVIENLIGKVSTKKIKNQSSGMGHKNMEYRVSNVLGGNTIFKESKNRRITIVRIG